MPKTKEDRRSQREEPYSLQHSSGRGYQDGSSRSQQRQHHTKKKSKRREDVDMGDGDNAPCSSFDAMNLKPDLLKGIYAYGFEKPSAIQQRAIRPIVRGRDVIAQSQSGTGKTVSIRKK